MIKLNKAEIGKFSNGMKRIAAPVYIFCIISLFVTAKAAMAVAGGNPTIRVSIADDKSFLAVSLKGKYKICGSGSGVVLSEGPFLNARIYPSGGALKIGDRTLGVPAIRVSVARDSNIYIDSRRFRGEMDIILKDNGKLMAINHTGLEEYLYGVLYHEISHRWPMEAIKAQAVAARTFAVNQIRQSALAPYDLRNDIYSQVYGGRQSEKWSTNRAVDLTRGEVLVYKGGIFPAYYHATCAGHTEDASKLWNIDIEPLKGIKCDFCRASPYYRWTKIIPLASLGARLAEAGYKTGGIAYVSVLGKDLSGRVDKLEIKGREGVSIVLTGKDFRQIIGPNEMRSTRFDVSVKGDSLVFEGYGWGHGVGMCQWGALGMAQKGKRYREILKIYYPGSEVTTIDKIKQ